MAWLEKRGQRFRVRFRYLGKEYHYGLKTENEREANALVGRLEDNLILLERGKLMPPDDGDLGLFLISDGKLNEKPKLAESLPLATFFRRYRQEYPTGAKEPNTQYTELIHMKHLERLIGAKTGVRSVTTDTLQDYIDERAKEKRRGGEVISCATIQKEIGTFASIWNKWAVPAGLVASAAPTKGLIYSKSKSRPPFQTWKQIEQRIKRGGLSHAEQKSLWESLFLSLGEIEQLLEHVKKTGRFPFIYPMFVFAAHTGARRSEILRSQIDDFDFTSGIVRIREKKKDRTRELTFRHVPVTPLLRSVMEDWFAKHPGGQLVICEEPNVPISAPMANHHFDWATDGSKWEKLRGWHIFRHSFISNCAKEGVDQRIIDAWSGHVTDAMRRRYTHLFPNEQQNSIRRVFGTAH